MVNEYFKDNEWWEAKANARKEGKMCTFDQNMQGDGGALRWLEIRGYKIEHWRREYRILPKHRKPSLGPYIIDARKDETPWRIIAVDVIARPGLSRKKRVVPSRPLELSYSDLSALWTSRFHPFSGRGIMFVSDRDAPFLYLQPEKPKRRRLGSRATWN